MNLLESMQRRTRSPELEARNPQPRTQNPERGDVDAPNGFCGKFIRGLNLMPTQGSG